MPRTINTSIPPSASAPASTVSYSTINTNNLPKPYLTLPDQCTNLSQTAEYVVETLQQQLELKLSKTANANDNIKDVGTPISIDEIQDAIDDGFLLCDLNVVQRKLKAWKIMFPRIKPFFAIKCNPDCMVSHVLGQTIYKNDGESNDNHHDHSGDSSCCCGFDCASLAEIQLALQSSYCNSSVKNDNKKNIVYANPQRSVSDLDRALELGVYALTFDSVEELHKVKNAYERLLCKKEEEKQENDVAVSVVEPPEMILRIVVPDTHSAVPLGEKFGVEPKYVQQLTQKALELDMDVIGVSFHCGSGNHDPTSYKDAISIAKSCIDEMNIILRQYGKNDCCVLDIGGGYPGYDGVGGDFSRFSFSTNSLSMEMHEKYEAETETAYKIAQGVSPLVDELFPKEEQIEIISEPGRYFVEAAFAYCARIYSVKKAVHPDQTDIGTNGTGSSTNDGSHRNHYYIAQGVQGLFKDVILCDEIFTPIPLQIQEGKFQQQDEEEERQMFSSVVHGPSGEDFDIVCKDCMLPEMNEGDWLLFDRMGAYTISIAARNSLLPIRYVIGGAGANA